ncbi:hypothetical protein CSUI_003255 [Cystoisospora suis]|uniref:Transmembrane protein n=1 Tax=Cystoisospora suis TaxID=483139 RepID=A0A2C6L1K2_9APIC|nr:hypothetical protein CSUI_003255 [Cystoisospora suis]
MFRRELKILCVVEIKSLAFFSSSSLFSSSLLPFSFPLPLLLFPTLFGTPFLSVSSFLSHLLLAFFLISFILVSFFFISFFHFLFFLSCACFSLVFRLWGR